jgi:hypothetical protein
MDYKNHADGMELLVRASAGEDVGDVIQDQEARGQARLAVSSTLPVETGAGNWNDDIDASLRAVGFKLGPTVKEDPLFRTVDFPAGWRVVPTDHSMWTDVLDAIGRVRVRVFYKAAFYDRKAHCTIERRYAIEIGYPPKDAAGEYIAEGKVVAVVRDRAEGVDVVRFARPYAPGSPLGRYRAGGEAYAATDDAGAAAEAYVAEHFPDARPSAYWDDADWSRA